MIRDALSKALREFRIGGFLRVISKTAQRNHFLNVIWRNCYMLYIRKKFARLVEQYRKDPPPKVRKTA